MLVCTYVGCIILRSTVRALHTLPNFFLLISLLYKTQYWKKRKNNRKCQNFQIFNRTICHFSQIFQKYSRNYITRNFSRNYILKTYLRHYILKTYFYFPSNLKDSVHSICKFKEMVTFSLLLENSMSGSWKNNWSKFYWQLCTVILTAIIFYIARNILLKLFAKSCKYIFP